MFILFSLSKVICSRLKINCLIEEWQGSNGMDELFNCFSTVNTLVEKSRNTSGFSIFVLTVIGLPHTSSVCNPGTTSQSGDFGIGILQSWDPGINPRIENLVKQPMATDQAERHQRTSYRLHRPAY